MKFDSKEFKNLYLLVKEDFPQLNEYEFYLATVAWEMDQVAKCKNNKKSKKKQKPDFTDIKAPTQEEITAFSKGAIVLSDPEPIISDITNEDNAGHIQSDSKSCDICSEVEQCKCESTQTV